MRFGLHWSQDGDYSQNLVLRSSKHEPFFRNRSSESALFSHPISHILKTFTSNPYFSSSHTFISPTLSRTKKNILLCSKKFPCIPAFQISHHFQLISNIGLHSPLVWEFLEFDVWELKYKKHFRFMLLTIPRAWSRLILLHSWHDRF